MRQVIFIENVWNFKYTIIKTEATIDSKNNDNNQLINYFYNLKERKSDPIDTINAFKIIYDCNGENPLENLEPWKDLNIYNTSLGKKLNVKSRLRWSATRSAYARYHRRARTVQLCSNAWDSTREPTRALCCVGPKLAGCIRSECTCST